MNNKPTAILLLRISYWTAAIADFAIAGLVLIPARMGTTEPVYPMGLAAAIAFSWAVMLLIADRKPLQRRWVLLPTCLVVILLTLTRLVFSLQGAVEFSLFLLLFGTALAGFIAYSYHHAGRHQ